MAQSCHTRHLFPIGFQAPGAKQGQRRISANAHGRREILTASLIVALQVNDSRTELLSKYLKKSEENKTKNDKERLESFYKRNYKDYFGLLEGTLRQKTEDQLTEAEKGILEWLDIYLLSVIAIYTRENA
ncbi:hypothetical protein LIER_26969 [Lithospermum erythrorhizon]|uniref:Uncharacterized protein n=1 Tax=Lithospermum erythrorhizon TaxID=34254 RepID=A0AAV3RAB1_LITER